MAEGTSSGASVDTSIYRQAPPANPLASILQIGQAADAMGNIAAGQATQQAINPQTGEIDRNMLAGLLKQTVAGSMKAIPTLNAVEQLRNAGHIADVSGLENFQKRMAITHHLFSGLASKDAPTGDDALEIATRALDPALNGKKYGITVPVVMNALKGLKDKDGKWLPPEQMKAKALEIQSQAAATGEILHQHSPQVRVIQNGQTIDFQPAGTTAAPRTGIGYPVQLPPTTPVATPGGQQYLGTQPVAPPVSTSTSPNRPATFDQRYDGAQPGGRPAPAMPPMPGPLGAPPVAAPVAAPVARRPMSAGAAPPGAEPTGSPSAPRPVVSQPFVPGAPTGPMAGFRPGYVAAAEGIAGASAGSANALTQAADAVPNIKTALSNLREDMKNFTAGGGADWTRIAKNWTGRNVPLPESWTAAGAVFDPKSVASQEQFNKQATMVAQQLFASIGGTGTDAKFSSAFATSPNETLSQLGNKGIINLLDGLNDAVIAKNKAWNAYKKVNGPDTYADFTQGFNEQFDPRVFQFKYLTPKERTEYILNIENEEDANQFKRNLAHAYKEKWVSFK